jgi:hypothetical protein
MIREQAIIYAAGLFDGEGSVGVYAAPPKQCIVRMSVGMSTPYGPAIFAELFGGHVKLCSHRRPKGATGDTYQPVYHWFLTSERAARALQELLPWLREKRAQAALAIEARGIQRRRPRGVGARWPLGDVARLEVIRAEIKALKRA